jgi:hypothetical protein
LGENAPDQPDGYESAAPQVILAAGRHSTQIKAIVEMSSCGDDTCSIAVGVYKR